MPIPIQHPHRSSPSSCYNIPERSASLLCSLLQLLLLLLPHQTDRRTKQQKIISSPTRSTVEIVASRTSTLVCYCSITRNNITYVHTGNTQICHATPHHTIPDTHLHPGPFDWYGIDRLSTTGNGDWRTRASHHQPVSIYPRVEIDPGRIEEVETAPVGTTGLS